MATAVPFRKPTPLPVDILKALPKNLEAERSILGAILMDNTAIAVTAKSGLTATHFSLDQHQVIFRHMTQLAAEHEPIEIVTMHDHLHKRGELDRAGGDPYIGSLCDGMPRVSNVAHYVKIVIEKHALRCLIHTTHELQKRAFDESESAELLLRNAGDQIFELQKPANDENPLVVVSYKELLTLDLPKADPLIEPLVTRAGTFMIFSIAGWGKSWIATEMAFDVAKGAQTIFGGHEGPGGHWPIYGPARTLYLYGEMHGEKIRERLKLIGKAHRTDGEFEGLGVASKDYQRISRAPKSAHAWRPSLITPSDRKAVEQRLFGEGFQFLVLDNISTLWSAAQEDQSHQTSVLKEWFVDLNSQGITVCFLQHAGKSGDYLGDSAQTHILDSYIRLSRPGDYRRSQGLRTILNVEKFRHELRDPHWGVPFEVQLVTSPENGAEWLTKTAAEALKKSAFEMFANGAPPMIVLQQMPTLSRATIYRWWKEHKDNRTSELRDGDEE